MSLFKYHFHTSTVNIILVIVINLSPVNEFLPPPPPPLGTPPFGPPLTRAGKVLCVDGTAQGGRPLAPPAKKNYEIIFYSLNKNVTYLYLAYSGWHFSVIAKKSVDRYQRTVVKGDLKKAV